LSVSKNAYKKLKKAGNVPTNKKKSIVKSKNYYKPAPSKSQDKITITDEIQVNKSRVIEYNIEENNVVKTNKVCYATSVESSSYSLIHLEKDIIGIVISKCNYSFVQNKKSKLRVTRELKKGFYVVFMGDRLVEIDGKFLTAIVK
jgi:hypothetical protein